MHACMFYSDHRTNSNIFLKTETCDMFDDTHLQKKKKQVTIIMIGICKW